ncbi:MAG TPA: 16S rRNA (guanine(527)-N(7))-methyltransferase RsmG [Dongiaceae bacterium]|nr:16S rRNA (guanine(527)-N(7))-methyltransferase RsmG [Dongiaceae bacterium]
MTSLDAAEFLSQIQPLAPDVSRETLAEGVKRLEIYAALLIKWQKAINLVGPATIPDLWRRHMLDSAQLLPLLPPITPGAVPEAGGAIADFGSGAGFPGLVLAALTERPVQLIDSDVRKCAFLRQTAQAMGIGGRVAVHAKRFDALQPWTAPVITARACAPLDQLLAWTAPFADESTVFLFLKGAKADEELTAAGKHWTMDIERHSSIVDSGEGAAGTVLKISHLRRK